MSEATVRAYTVRLELVDEPGELLGALEPIADNGGNLLSIFHERGNVTPRGHIPVEVDLEATEAQFETIVDALREAGVNVIQAGAERYSEELTVVLVGHLVETDLSDTLQQIQECGGASVADVSLSAADGTDEESSARLRLVASEGHTSDALETIQDVADKKDLRVVEPLTGVPA
ncbi:ACT domain protein [Natronomonas pharaonis DSM 2160]|uniref:ACT domain protein n=1 Tax=Natronomonas pharaonis (strain ATCC 35678 / DSM 2160 / CIP 103997 / JCM 8858 / NBRC 14720 / NCIMB 2260 / Gabara) TaxID=348780 RepID=A0A1U7ETJ7_NATPD|nr:amino acid-binding protein [Natronomonas pharaonis]CAI48241.1 ACT domain protein [Natronomonas pharaonis DSM 2160]